MEITSSVPSVLSDDVNDIERNASFGWKRSPTGVEQLEPSTDGDDEKKAYSVSKSQHVNMLTVAACDRRRTNSEHIPKESRTTASLRSQFGTSAASMERSTRSVSNICVSTHDDFPSREMLAMGLSRLSETSKDGSSYHGDGWQSDDSEVNEGSVVKSPASFQQALSKRDVESGEPPSQPIVSSKYLKVEGILIIHYIYVCVCAR